MRGRYPSAEQQRAFYSSAAPATHAAAPVAPMQRVPTPSVDHAANADTAASPPAADAAEPPLPPAARTSPPPTRASPRDVPSPLRNIPPPAAEQPSAVPAPPMPDAASTAPAGTAHKHTLPWTPRPRVLSIRDAAPLQCSAGPREPVTVPLT